jgi:large subunit ribosomal protein L32
MAEPKKRLTQTRSGNRRSHLALKAMKLSTCQKCNEPVKPHNVCTFCGTYKGEQVISIDKKNKK